MQTLMSEREGSVVAESDGRTLWLNIDGVCAARCGPRGWEVNVGHSNAFRGKGVNIDGTLMPEQVDEFRQCVLNTHSIELPEWYPLQTADLMGYGPTMDAVDHALAPSERDMRRVAAYKAIDTERDYQERLPPERTDGSSKSVGDYLTMLDFYLIEAKHAFVKNPGTVEVMDVMRKVAGIAVKCMEEHGAYARGATHITVQEMLKLESAEMVQGGGIEVPPLRPVTEDLPTIEDEEDIDFEEATDGEGVGPFRIEAPWPRTPTE